jgi:hypothetical protein
MQRCSRISTGSDHRRDSMNHAVNRWTLEGKRVEFDKWHRLLHPFTAVSLCWLRRWKQICHIWGPYSGTAADTRHLMWRCVFRHFRMFRRNVVLPSSDDPEGGGTTMLRDIGNYPPNDSITPKKDLNLWKQNLQHSQLWVAQIVFCSCLLSAACCLCSAI